MSIGPLCEHCHCKLLTCCHKSVIQCIKIKQFSIGTIANDYSYIIIGRLAIYSRSVEWTAQTLTMNAEWI